MTIPKDKEKEEDIFLLYDLMEKEIYENKNLVRGKNMLFFILFLLNMNMILQKYETKVNLTETKTNFIGTMFFFLLLLLHYLFEFLSSIVDFLIFLWYNNVYK